MQVRFREIKIMPDQGNFIRSTTKYIITSTLKENTSLKEPHHQTQESLPPTKPNNNETQHKNKNNCDQKQLYIGNLNTNIVEEDLNQLFRIRSTKYLQGTCSIKMPVNQKTET